MMIAGTASMTGIVQWQAEHTWLFWLQPLGLVLFLIAGVAENNRAPFDLPEAENELVAGFHTEYTGMKCAFFFLAEYISMIVVSGMVATLFLGGWRPVTLGLGYIVKDLPGWLAGDWGGPWVQFLAGVFWFAMKVVFVIYCYLWFRATFPRYRRPADAGGLEVPDPGQPGVDPGHRRRLMISPSIFSPMLRMPRVAPCQKERVGILG